MRQTITIHIYRVLLKEIKERNDIGIENDSGTHTSFAQIRVVDKGLNQVRLGEQLFYVELKQVRWFINIIRESAVRKRR